MTRFADQAGQVQSTVTISSVHVDPEVMARHKERNEILSQLATEKLPGPVKSKWALNYKLGMDKAVEDALSVRQAKAEKVKTEGRFNIQANTNAGNWLVDRSWTYLANPSYALQEDRREELDMRLMVKRQKQKAI